MQNEELKRYFASYAGEKEVAILLANPQKRKMYECVGVELITDMGKPVIGIIVGEESNMESELVAVGKECESNDDILKGQMEISDYPGIVPEEVAVNE